MKLWHVSETPGINLFEPRLPPSPDAGIDYPVVWAIAESHLVNYLLPRDCPRIAIRRAPHSTESDIHYFFGAASAEVIIYIEAPWLYQSLNTPVWLYEMPAESFACADTTAGYFVACQTVAPISACQINSPLSELLNREVELRIVSRLRTMAETIKTSSLTFSIIRLRNALP